MNAIDVANSFLRSIMLKQRPCNCWIYLFVFLIKVCRMSGILGLYLFHVCYNCVLNWYIFLFTNKKEMKSFCMIIYTIDNRHDQLVYNFHP